MGRKPRVESAEETTPEYQDTVLDVGQRIKTFRQKRGWTQYQLADRAEKAQPYIYELETGGANPTLRMLAHFARVLDVDLRELMPEGTHGAAPSNLALEQQEAILDRLAGLLTTWEAQAKQRLEQEEKRCAEERAAIQALMAELRVFPTLTSRLAKPRRPYRR